MNIIKKATISTLILFVVSIAQTYTCVAMEQSDLGKIRQELQRIRKNVKEYYPPHLVYTMESSIAFADGALMRAQKALNAQDPKTALAELTNQVLYRVQYLTKNIKHQYREQFQGLIPLVEGEISKLQK